MPTLAAIFKWQQVPSPSETWYGCLDRAANCVSEVMLVSNGLTLLKVFYVEDSASGSLHTPHCLVKGHFSLLFRNRTDVLPTYFVFWNTNIIQVWCHRTHLKLKSYRRVDEASPWNLLQKLKCADKCLVLSLKFLYPVHSSVFLKSITLVLQYSLECSW